MPTQPPADVSSGKTAKDENFPVGSLLIPARLRPTVAAFYAFARAADDIADSPDLPASEKVARLNRMDAVLTGTSGAISEVERTAERLRPALAEAGITDRHARNLLIAFRQDATKLRYADWPDLMGYCANSAAPVGRFLFDLHGEARDGWPASDALCNALQVLNHLQDCQVDYRTLDRVYLPQDWLAEQGLADACLDAPQSAPEFRLVLDACLEATDGLLAEARGLPQRIADRRLAMEAAIIVHLAHRLAALLRQGDPLAGRVGLSKLDFVRCGIMGVWTGLVTSRRARRRLVRDGAIAAASHGG